jgi:hypothetical protein
MPLLLHAVRAISEDREQVTTSNDSLRRRMVPPRDGSTLRAYQLEKPVKNDEEALVLHRTHLSDLAGAFLTGAARVSQVYDNSACAEG